MSAEASIAPPQRRRGRQVARAVGRVASFFFTLAVTFVGLTAVTFFISRLTNIDPVLAVTGDRVSQETYDKVFLELGLDKPPIVQYFIYLKRLLTGDFGMQAGQLVEIISADDLRSGKVSANYTRKLIAASRGFARISA